MSIDFYRKGPVFALSEKSPKQIFLIVALLIAYGGLFTALRATSSGWQFGELFSLWFPAAGVRFAFLWMMGSRWTVPAALSELTVGLLSGEVSLEPAPIASLLGIIGPCLLYGLAIGFIQEKVAEHSPVLGMAPLPFAVAAVSAPLIGCIGALPWALPRALMDGVLDASDLLSSLLVFALGDALGILLVAPPLVWLVDWRTGKGLPAITFNGQIAFELAVVQGVAWSFVWGTQQAGYGVVLAPVLLAAGWTGLRTGRVGGWVAIIVSAVILLPISYEGLSPGDEVRVHTLIATLAAIAYLAGAFSDAQRKGQSEIRRRDRLLYQAERLKTLRGMSVAIIHEVSQPLSTIEIEAENLAGITAGTRVDMDEVRETSALIARKSRDLANLVRQLRRFGERDDDPPQEVLLERPLRDVRKIVEVAALERNIELSFPYRCLTIVKGYDVEIRQAILNLLTNAIAAAPSGGRVAVRSSEGEGLVKIAVTNMVDSSQPPKSGMGVGLIVARSIAEAHGGRIERKRLEDGHTEFAIFLPLAGASDE